MDQRTRIVSDVLVNELDLKDNTSCSDSAASTSTKKSRRKRRLRRKGSLKLLIDSGVHVKLQHSLTIKLPETTSETEIDNEVKLGSKSEREHEIEESSQSSIRQSDNSCLVENKDKDSQMETSQEENNESTVNVSNESNHGLTKKISEFSLKSIFKKTKTEIEDTSNVDNTFTSNSTRKSVSFRDFDDEISMKSLTLPSPVLPINTDTVLSRNLNSVDKKLRNDSESTRLSGKPQGEIIKLNVMRSCSSIKEAVRLSLENRNSLTQPIDEPETLEREFFDPNDHSPNMQFVPLLTDESPIKEEIEVNQNHDAAIVDIDCQLRQLLIEMKQLKARKRELKAERRKQWLHSLWYPEAPVDNRQHLQEEEDSVSDGKIENIIYNGNHNDNATTVSVASWTLPWIHRPTNKAA